jgi:hypothetical protein
MPSRHAFFRFSTASLLLPTLAFAATSPEKLLGHPVGADRKLADYGQIVVTGRAAIVEANLGKGRVELLGRASSSARRWSVPTNSCSTPSCAGD